MIFERFTAARRRISRAGILLAGIVLALLMSWIPVSGGSPRRGTGHALRASRQLAPATPQRRDGASPARPRPRVGARLAEAYGRLPLSFEATRGQVDGKVSFLSRGRGYTLFLTGDEAVLSLRSQESGVRSQKQEGCPGSLAQGTKDKGPWTNDVLRMKLAGANPAPEASALDRLPGTANYFIGN